MRLGSLDAERRNDLRLAIVRDLEIFFFQAGDDVALAVAHYGANQNQIDADLKRCGIVVGGNFRGVAGVRRSRGRRRGLCRGLRCGVALRGGFLSRGRRRLRTGSSRGKHRQAREQENGNYEPSERGLQWVRQAFLFPPSPQCRHVGDTPRDFSTQTGKHDYTLALILVSTNGRAWLEHLSCGRRSATEEAGGSSAVHRLGTSLQGPRTQSLSRRSS